MDTAAAIDRTKQILGFTKTKLVYILAIILIASGAYELYCVATASYSDTWEFRDEILSAVIKLVMAEFMIFDPKKNILRAVGFYAMSLGLSRIVNGISTLFSVSTISLVVGGVMLVMGINMLISSYNYLNDTSRGRTGMMFSACMLSLLQVVLLVMTYESVRLAFDPPEKVEIVPNVIQLFQFIVLLLILDTKEARFSTAVEKVNTRLESARVTYTVEYDMAIPRPGAVMLKHMFDDRSQWTTVEDGGPAESECTICVKDGRIPSYLVLQKWKGSDKIHVTAVNDTSGSVVLAKRFSVSEVYADSDDDCQFSVLRLFDEKRLLLQIFVEEYIPEEVTE